MIVGHRGAAALAPENTLSAIKKAAEAGISWIEIDTQLTADCIPVVFHDETIDRCTNGNGKLANYTLSQLKLLDTGSWFGPEFVNERIATLAEVFELCSQLNISINLELKVHNEDQVIPLVKEVADVIASSAFKPEKLLLSSFSIQAVKECQHVLSNIRRGYITEEKTISYLKKVKLLNLYSVHVDYTVLDKNMANLIKDSGYVLNVWTLNDPTKVDALHDMGVDNIITDDPTIF